MEAHRKTPAAVPVPLREGGRGAGGGVFWARCQALASVEAVPLPQRLHAEVINQHLAQRRGDARRVKVGGVDDLDAERRRARQISERQLEAGEERAGLVVGQRDLELLRGEVVRGSTTLRRIAAEQSRRARQ